MMKIIRFDNTKINPQSYQVEDLLNRLLAGNVRFILIMLIAIAAAGRAAALDLNETNQGHACASNSDCWCQEFNGAEFLPGKDKSFCCTTEAIDGFVCSKPNYCANCIYD